MPETQPEKKPRTLTQWKKDIADYCMANRIVRSSGQIERMSIKAKKRIDREEETDDAITFERALRILGIHSDTTARDAARNLEGLAA